MVGLNCDELYSDRGPRYGILALPPTSCELGKRRHNEGCEYAGL